MFTHAMTVKTILIALIAAGCPKYEHLSTHYASATELSLEDMGIASEDSVSPLSGTITVQPNSLQYHNAGSRESQIEYHEAQAVKLKKEIAQDKKCTKLENDLKAELARK